MSVKIADLTEAEELSPESLLLIVDSESGTTKRITAANAAASLGGGARDVVVHDTADQLYITAEDHAGKVVLMTHPDSEFFVTEIWPEEAGWSTVILNGTAEAKAFDSDPDVRMKAGLSMAVAAWGTVTVVAAVQGVWAVNTGTIFVTGDLVQTA